jgi:hypothetical protein
MVSPFPIYFARSLAIIGWGLLMSTGFAKNPVPSAAPAPVKAAQLDIAHKWVRYATDANGDPLGMQTSIVRYQKPGETSYVDLVGAIHVGDAKYYAELNRRFAQYDALLYELVAPEGTRIEKDAVASDRHPLGMLQGGMKDVLELEHQLEQVDYTRPNFVHADMSPEEFFKSMDQRGEGIVQIFFRMMGASITEQSKLQARGESPDIDLMKALFAPDRARQLKIAFARQLTQMESLLNDFGGAQGSTLITERNKKALEVLARERKAGKQKIGIFYGAGHLTDMHERMVNEFGMKPVSEEWLTAWDLSE